MTRYRYPFSLNKSGPVDVKSILPCPNTVSDYVHRLATESKSSKRNELSTILDKNGGCLSVDYGKKIFDYISVSLHYVHGW